MLLLSTFTFTKWRPKQVQIWRRISTPEDRLNRFSRNAQATNWIKVMKKNICLSKRICFLRFVLTEILKWTTWFDVWFGRSKDDFFPVLKSEINGANDDLVEVCLVLLLLTNQLAGFPAPITFRFAYFFHAFPVNKYPRIITIWRVG